VRVDSTEFSTDNEMLLWRHRTCMHRSGVERCRSSCGARPGVGWDRSRDPVRTILSQTAAGGSSQSDTVESVKPLPPAPFPLHLLPTFPGTNRNNPHRGPRSRTVRGRALALLRIGSVFFGRLVSRQLSNRQPIEWTRDAAEMFATTMQIDHRGHEVGVTEQLADRQ
jgi:hypothetical protein